MPAQIAIGNDSFVDLRQKGLEYVDKSRLIQDIIDDAGTLVLLLPRPRRFGKTLNMTMLDTFFARREEDYSSLFLGLHIAGAGDAYWQHFRRYPTIFLNMKDLKPQSIQTWEDGIRLRIGRLFQQHKSVLEQPGLLDETDRAHLSELVNETGSPSLLRQSLLMLCEWLHRATGEKVLILIDEYDSPIHAAWLADQEAGRIIEPGPGELASPESCYRAVVDFYRTFFGAALKSNPHLFKGILTGILRVSKESIFSDLNNIQVWSLLEYPYCDAFGFTQGEVIDLCERQGQREHFPLISLWYNGYLFGEQTIYNPWSVLNFLRNPDKTPRAHWLNSSGNALIKHQLARHAIALHDDFQTLLAEGEIVRRVKRNFVFTDLDSSIDAVYSLLLFSGYLKARQLPADPGEPADHALSIPNREVREIYLESFQTWLNVQLGGRGGQVELLLKAIMGGDVRTFQRLLSRMAAHMLSYQDGDADDPEALYHGLMLGLCASLEPKYRVRSNRESGAGRPDLLIMPARAGLGGAVLEFKVTDERESLEQALQRGRTQLITRNYRAELDAMNVTPIYQYAVAFDGKTVKVERVES